MWGFSDHLCFSHPLPCSCSNRNTVDVKTLTGIAEGNKSPVIGHMLALPGGEQPQGCTYTLLRKVVRHGGRPSLVNSPAQRAAAVSRAEEIAWGELSFLTVPHDAPNWR